MLMKGVFKFIVLLFLAIQVHAESLVVSGISDPTAANGIYKLQGTLYGYSYWKHETSSYFLYNKLFQTSQIWNIDTDTDDAAVLFYSGTSTNTPPISESWVGNGATATTGKGAPSVIVYTGILTPEITVRGNTSIIANGTTTFNYNNNTLFGVAIANSGSITRTFTIENTGAAALAITNVSIGGTNASQFSVTQPSTSIAANTGTTTFSVTYTPKSVGPHTATITIANSDADEGSYTFAVKSTGYAPANLVVADITAPTAANGTYVYQGLLNDYPYWKHQTLGYYIYNENYQSARYWTIDDDKDGSTDDFLFYKQSDDATPLGLTSWTPTGTSVTGAPSITSATSEPDIEILGNTLTIALSDASPTVFDFTSFGAVNYASGSRTRTYTIKNSGNAVLTLSGTSPYVKVSGDNASEFTISSAPAASIAAGSSTTFTVSFDPSATGTRSAQLTIASNDADEASYTFVINGEGYTAQDLAVSGITTPAAANGKYLHQGTLNDFQYWKHESADYWIYNTPYQNARYWQIDVDQDANKAFFYSNTSEQATPISATSWSSGTTTVTGAGTPVIQFASVEINVTGNSQSIADGDITPTTLDYTDFGNANVSTSVIRTFTIQNTGSLALNLTGTPIVAISGTHASEFVVTQPSAATVTPSGTTTFTVAFTPQGGGLRSAALSIANNDGDESPYNFNIQGTGLVAPVVTTEAVTAIATTTATGNGTLTNLGEPATVTAYGVCWSTSSNPTTTSSKASLSSTTATGAFTASITSLTPGTLYYVRAFATNATGTSYGAEQTFTAAVPNLSVATATVAIAQTAGSTAQASLSANINWTASSDQAWLAVAPASGTGDATLTFTAQANPLASTRSATVTVTGTGVTAKTITITQAAGAATLAVSPSITSLAKTAGSTSATVTSNTAWTATSNQTWLTLSAASGTGDATLTLTATANPTIAERTATITLKATGATDKSITVTQAAGDATLAISPSTANLVKTAASTSATVTSNTNWTVASNQTWLTLSVASGTGDATFTLTATANPTIAERTAVITLKATGATAKTITVTQAAGDATFEVSQNAFNMDKEAGSESVILTSNTAWTAASNQTWLTLSATSGTGDATFTLTTTANLTIAERTAIITLKATGTTVQTITITQAAGAATLAVSPSITNLAKTAGSTSATVTSNTDWTAQSNQTWLTLSAASGTGDATLTLTATANPTVAERTATITLKAINATDKTITVTQAAGDATLAISPSTANLVKTAASTSATITSNTDWTAQSDQAWLTVAATSGNGNATLTLTATANPTIAERTVTITLKATNATDKTITVTQAAGDATLAASQNALNMGKEAGSKSVNVTSNSDWAANSDQTWLTVSSTSGTGDATLTFTAEANAMDAERSATITLKVTNAKDQVITVVQAGNATLTLTSNTLDMVQTAGTEDVGITSNTTWAATSGQTWLTITPASGTGDATLTLSAEANATTTERTAVVTLKATGLTDRTITVTQAAGAATLAVAPTTASFTSKAGSASATVTSNTAWTAASNQTWLTLSAASGTGDATLTLTVTANTSASPRTATIMLKATGAADQTIAVTQSAATTGVAQLASHLPTLSLLRNSGAALELGLCNFKHSSLTLELYALDGRKVLARSLGNLGNGMQSVSVDWSMLPAGTYLVTLKGNGQIIVNLQVMKRP